VGGSSRSNASSAPQGRQVRRPPGGLLG
jgi:hypothetical protein